MRHTLTGAGLAVAILASPTTTLAQPQDATRTPLMRPTAPMMPYSADQWAKVEAEARASCGPATWQTFRVVRRRGDSMTITTSHMAKCLAKPGS